jgi:alpha-ketoglutarate-dependent 2,4-dichlorophenoxyacetate dioxygenase
VRLRSRALHDLFGAEIIGSEITDGDPALTSAINDAIGARGLLLFRGANFDDDDLARFAARFGPLQNMTSQADARLHVIRVTNLTEDGNIKDVDEASRRRHEPNKLWHVDSSFIYPGATYSFLQARIVPKAGGETEFCDGRAAWDALAPAQQRHLMGLTAHHSIAHSWRLVGVEAPAPSQPPSVVRKLVHRHTPSGRETLNIPSHVERIDGLDPAQTRVLLEELIQIAAAPERVYRHKWKEGDLLMWDNRCMLHRVAAYREFEDPRDLRSCRVVDVNDTDATAQAPRPAAGQYGQP